MEGKNQPAATKSAASFSSRTFQVMTCCNGQGIVWSVAPVDPATNVAITAFGGQAVGSGSQYQINPVQLPATWGSPWQATTTINQGTSGTQYQYTMSLQFGGPTGKTLWFDPFLKSDVA
jgi:hypothetical protein